MKLFRTLGIVPAMSLALLVAPLAHAATTPSLGAAATYGVLSDTYSNPIGPTTINGDVGFTTGPAVAPLGVHANYGSGGNYSTAGTAAAAALVNLNSQLCTFTFVAPDVVLDTTLEHGTSYAPGVYCSTGTMAVGTAGGITLTGAGTYIFRSGGALNTVAGSTVNLGPGASACDVFWTPNGDTTLNANSTFVGTVIPVAQDITVYSTTNWLGRALTFLHTVTTPNSNVVITTPTCVAPVPPVFSSNTPPPIINVRKVPTPLALPNGPGSVTYNYTVTNGTSITLTDVTLVDDKCSNVQFLGGDTNADGWLETNETWTYSCTTTLNSTTVNYATARGIGNGLAAVDTAIAEVVVGLPIVPPLIHVIKTPSPLNLPAAGGSVTYSYTVTNPGTVPLTGVTLTDNKCSNPTFVSGDTNGDSRLQSTEAWHYTCTTNLSLTTTNTAIATGHANGLTAVDTALATVVLAGSPVPPLIHIIKQASPVLLPSTGGSVTYTFWVTNPGTVALDNVSVNDDHCGAVTFVSGDTNGNGLMETNETWTYTCQQNLTVATTNTATATGHGNGLTVTDVAIASVALSPAPVVVPPPVLPNTGIDPNSLAAMLGLLAAALALLAVTQWTKLFR
jgi:uncharacterized repeat protein (TIGR01451 family)/LPXTG-motif cell wall-anchored protein